MAITITKDTKIGELLMMDRGVAAILMRFCKSIVK